MRTPAPARRPDVISATVLPTTATDPASGTAVERIAAHTRSGKGRPRPAWPGDRSTSPGVCHPTEASTRSRMAGGSTVRTAVGTPAARTAPTTSAAPGGDRAPTGTHQFLQHHLEHLVGTGGGVLVVEPPPQRVDGRPPHGPRRELPSLRVGGVGATGQSEGSNEGLFDRTGRVYAQVNADEARTQLSALVTHLVRCRTTAPDHATAPDRTAAPLPHGAHPTGTR